MSSRGNLLDAEYTADVIAVGRDHSGVFGFIGNGSNPNDIRRLRKSAGEGKMIWTPGVNINVGDGELGKGMEAQKRL